MKSWFISISETEVSSPLCRGKGERPNAAQQQTARRWHNISCTVQHHSLKFGWGPALISNPCFICIISWSFLV